MPPNPTSLIDPRPNRALVTQSHACVVAPHGLLFLTDQNGGLNILQFEG